MNQVFINNLVKLDNKANGWEKPRVLRAMRTVKEYVRVTCLGQEEILPVYQYCRD